MHLSGGRVPRQLSTLRYPSSCVRLGDSQVNRMRDSMCAEHPWVIPWRGVEEEAQPRVMRKRRESCPVHDTLLLQLP